MRPGDTVGGRHSDLPPGLHGPRPGDRELLLDLTGAAVGGVIALDQEKLRSSGQGGVDGLVIGELEQMTSPIVIVRSPKATRITPAPCLETDCAPTSCKIGSNGSSWSRKGTFPKGTRLRLS